MTYRANHQWRNLTYGYELSPAERAEFDYIAADDFDSHDFLRYLGRVYDVSEFVSAPADMVADGWHGYSADSYFSGVAIKLSRDLDSAQVATYYT